MNPAEFKKLHKLYPSLNERTSSDHYSLDVSSEELLGLLLNLKKLLSYDMLMDVAAVDWGQGEAKRFGVFYHLYSSLKNCYVRVCALCESNDQPEMPSTVGLWPAANWHEREAFDMMGIHFKGHPDLRRILMWDAYPYHPLRKEFPLAGIETEFPAADVEQSCDAKVAAAPMMGGPFNSKPGSNMSKSEPTAKDESWTETHPKPLS